MSWLLTTFLHVILILERRKSKLRGLRNIPKTIQVECNGARILHSEFGPDYPYHTDQAKITADSVLQYLSDIRYLLGGPRCWGYEINEIVYILQLFTVQWGGTSLGSSFV